MLIIPAIDIIQKKVVRLYQGDFNKAKSYSDDPVSVARAWQKKGAMFLHIVDLDGARCGEIKNRDIIEGIIKGVDIPCEVGGGLREDKDIEYFLVQGARRVVIGTSALEDMGYLKELVSRFGDKVVISVDFTGEKVVKKGWQEETGLSPETVASKMKEMGVSTLIITDIKTDGTLKGPNIKRLKKILDSVDIPIIASGGVSGIEDIKRLKEIGSKNLEGVIIGRALYEGKVDLEEAIEVGAHS